MLPRCQVATTREVVHVTWRFTPTVVRLGSSPPGRPFRKARIDLARRECLGRTNGFGRKKRTNTMDKGGHDWSGFRNDHLRRVVLSRDRCVICRPRCRSRYFFNDSIPKPKILLATNRLLVSRPRCNDINSTRIHWRLGPVRFWVTQAYNVTICRPSFAANRRCSNYFSLQACTKFTSRAQVYREGNYTSSKGRQGL